MRCPGPGADPAAFGYFVPLQSIGVNEFIKLTSLFLLSAKIIYKIKKTFNTA